MRETFWVALMLIGRAAVGQPTPAIPGMEEATPSAVEKADPATAHTVKPPDTAKPVKARPPTARGEAPPPKAEPVKADLPRSSEEAASVSAPSLLPAALCEELRRPREAPETIELAALAAERKSLEKLSNEIARSRKALKAEIARLEALTAATRTKPPEVTLKEAPALPADPQQLAVLARTVKAMKPAEAAELISRMKPALAVDLLRRLSPKSAAALISRLKPELAATFVATLATRPQPEGQP